MLLSFSLRTKKRRKKFPALLFWRFIVRCFGALNVRILVYLPFCPLLYQEAILQICKGEVTIRMKKANGNVFLLPEENVIVCVGKKSAFSSFSLPKNVSCNRRIVFVSPRLILSVSYDLLLSFSSNCFSCLLVFSTNFPLPRLFVWLYFLFSSRFSGCIHQWRCILESPGKLYSYTYELQQ